jgi:hypothetical protein
MTVIERKIMWIATHPDVPPRLLGDIEAAHFRKFATWTVEEYVPAEQLRGAVEALDALVPYLKAANAGDEGASAIALAMVKAALATARGR